MISGLNQLVKHLPHTLILSQQVVQQVTVQAFNSCCKPGVTFLYKTLLILSFNINKYINGMNYLHSISLLLTAEMDLIQATAALAGLIKYLEVLCFLTMVAVCMYSVCMWLGSLLSVCLREVSSYRRCLSYRRIAASWIRFRCDIHPART